MGANNSYPISYFPDNLLEDAERIKNEQTKRIETLERDLKAAQSKRGAFTAKNESSIGAVKTIVCQSFSADNHKVIVSNGKRSVKSNYDDGYCFLNHPKLQKNHILKWSLRVPKCRHGYIGMVIMPE